MPQQPAPPDWKALEVHPVAALFPAATPDEYETLKQDILERGQQEPILLYEGKILDGQTRYRACKALDIEPKFAAWEGDQTTLAAWLQVKGSNLIRRHLTAERRVAILRLSAQQFPEVQTTIQAIVGAAELRQQLGLKAVNQDDGGPGEAADFMGRLVGVSGSTVKRVLRVERDFPDRLKDIADGKATVSQVLKPEAGKVVVKAPAAAGGKKYRLIYADLGHGKLEDKPVPAWTEYKSALALWTTAARLPDAIRLLLRWGWDYRTTFVWDKGKEAELLLVATKNHPPAVYKTDKVVIKDKAVKDGGKSELFRELILHIFPDSDGSRLDLFSQPVPEGWDQEPAPVEVK